MAPPARTITVALDMSKAFDTINIHTLIIKLLHTKIPGIIIKLIANYIKGRKAYTTYINHTSSQFKTGVPQVGVLSPTLFNIYTAGIPPPRAPIQVMVCTYDIPITSTHTSTSAAQKYIQPYLYKVFAWTKTNNLTLNPDKTTCTPFTPNPAEYKSNIDLKMHPTTHGNSAKGSGPYLRDKTHIQHMHSQHLSTSTQSTTNDKSTHSN